MMISTLSASFFNVFNDDTVDFFDAFNENFFVLILLQIRQELSVSQNFVQLSKIHRARDELINKDTLRFTLREGVSLDGCTVVRHTYHQVEHVFWIHQLSK